MTAPLVPAPLIAAPQPINPRRYGLFDAASGPLDLPGHGEGGGVRFVPDACAEGVAYGVTCYGGDNPAPEKPLSGDPDPVTTGVFVALTTIECNAVGYRLTEMRDKVRRDLEGTEQTTVEKALWSGLDLEGNDLGILVLDGPGTSVVPAGYDEGLITDVVAALERYAYTDQGYGSPAYLHAPIEVAAFAAEAGLILPESNSPNARKRTPMGSVWAFGAYPAGEIIVTGQTTVWRAPEIQVYDAFQQTTNLRFLVAERAYAVGFECFAGRATFDPLEVTSP